MKFTLSAVLLIICCFGAGHALAAAATAPSDIAVVPEVVTTELVLLPALDTTAVCAYGKYDLTPLSVGHMSYAAKAHGFSYHLNFCGKSTAAAPYCSAAAGSMCQYESKTQSRFGLLNWDDSGVWSEVSGGGGVQVAFANGEMCGAMPRHTTVTILCDAEEQSVHYVVNEHAPCKYEVVLRHAVGCGAVKPLPLPPLSLSPVAPSGTLMLAATGSGEVITIPSAGASVGPYTPTSNCAAGPYDLSSLSDSSYPYSSGSASTYYLNFCGPSTAGAPMCVGPSSMCLYQFTGSFVSLMQWDMSGVWNDCPLANCPNGGVQVTFANGEACGSLQRKTIFNINCDPSITTVDYAVGEPQVCTYVIQMSHAVGCRANYQTSSTGSVGPSPVVVASSTGVAPPNPNVPTNCASSIGSNAYDLSSLFGTDYYKPVNGFTYSLNFCGPTKAAMPYCKAPASACQYESSTQQMFSLLTWDNSGVYSSCPSKFCPNGGVQVSFANGASNLCGNRKTNIYINCQAGQFGVSYSVSEPQSCVYNILLNHDTGCPARPTPVISSTGEAVVVWSSSSSTGAAAAGGAGDASGLSHGALAAAIVIPTLLVFAGLLWFVYRRGQASALAAKNAAVTKTVSGAGIDALASTDAVITVSGVNDSTAYDPPLTSIVVTSAGAADYAPLISNEPSKNSAGAGAGSGSGNHLSASTNPASSLFRPPTPDTGVRTLAGGSVRTV